MAKATRRRLHPGFRPGDRGAAALEFAILLPVFLLLVLGGLDMALLVYSKAVLGNTARDAARAASLGAPFVDVQSIAENNNTGLLGSVQGVDIACPDDQTLCEAWESSATPLPPGTDVRVTITYQNRWLTPVLPAFVGLGSGLTITGANTMVVE